MIFSQNWLNNFYLLVMFLCMLNSTEVIIHESAVGTHDVEPELGLLSFQLHHWLTTPELAVVSATIIIHRKIQMRQLT